ncbi:MAG: hypothetical protein K0U98_27285 [Deltaproteobacteria bacterium]|nr:hypothetical protein [Deltaproteobacteria bacterium]
MREKYFRSTVAVSLWLAVLWVALGTPLGAQGRTDYMNVESPHLHPIEVARISGYDYLLVCNTPDGTVEVLDTNENILPQNRLLARIPVGQEPVSVRYSAALERFYTANFLGDSISVVGITAPNGPGSLSAQLEQTTFVGDEPLDVSFFDNQGTPTVVITHMSPDSFSWRDAVTLAPVIPGLSERLDASVVIGNTTFALKEPRTTLSNAQGLYILGGKGGNTPTYDLDIWMFDLATSTFRSIAGVGATNFNMAAASNGDLFVVSQDALNRLLFPEPMVAGACTGFAPSVLSWVQNPSSANPTILRRDLNSVAGSGTCNSVGKTIALTQPTDLALFEVGGSVSKVFVSALSSDRIGVIDPNSATPINWPRRVINISPIVGSVSPKAGPVALALKAANGGVSTDPGARLYVLNRFDSSVTIIDPVAETVVGEMDLAVDPRPAHIIAGQHFLYDAEQSGNGFSACSTCHPYGRTDGFAWDLGSPGQPQSAFNLNFADGIVMFNAVGLDFTELLDNLNNGFSDDKGLMVSQSLQGLLNFELDMSNRLFTSNAPYYWRGTRFDFPDFNGGFQNLMLGPGLSPPDMAAYHEFINTIHYPPNPEQPKDRVYSGTVGTGGNPSTLAQSGLEMFHVRPLCLSVNCFPELEANRSCVHCHSLPEGSNNRATEFLANNKLGPTGPSSDVVALETAALRGLIQKQAVLDKTAFGVSPIRTGLEGLSHTGGSASINAFNLVFTPFFTATELTDLNQFVHEMDWGVGPMIGVPQTVNPGNVANALNFTPPLDCANPASASFNAILCMEAQADIANAGVAVQVNISGFQAGLWYDPTQLPPVYWLEPFTGFSITRAGLLGLVTNPGDQLVFQSVPLGDERRIAGIRGTTVPIPGVAPASLSLLPMVPDTSYQRVQTLTANWNNFTWPYTNPPFNPSQPQAIFPHILKVFQHGLIQNAVPQNGFGLGLPGTPLRHDSPRRFRVSGNNIRHGAELHVFIPNDVLGPPNPNGPQDQINTIDLAIPLYPTTERDPTNGNLPVWQTAVELEPFFYYAMMLGGGAAPGVAATFNDWFNTISEPPPPAFFDPLNWNFHFIQVVNADGTLGSGGWQPIFVQ